MTAWIHDELRRLDAAQLHVYAELRRAGLPVEPARIYFPPQALVWVDVDQLAERAGRPGGTFDEILTGPTPAAEPPAPLGQPVNAGRHVSRRRR